jgi:hypothetical protein
MLGKRENELEFNKELFDFLALNSTRIVIFQMGCDGQFLAQICESVLKQSIGLKLVQIVQSVQLILSTSKSQ